MRGIVISVKTIDLNQDFFEIAGQVNTTAEDHFSIAAVNWSVRFLGDSLLQVCLDAGAKKVPIPITSAAEIGTVPSDLIWAFSLIFNSTPQEAVFKALGVEWACC